MKQTIEIEVPDGKKAVWKDDKIVFEEAPWYKKEKFNPDTLKPFDKVLACFTEQSTWCCGLFSYFTEDANLIVCCGDAYYKYCIPYNDETKHLVGTTDEAPEYYRYWED